MNNSVNQRFMTRQQDVAGPLTTFTQNDEVQSVYQPSPSPVVPPEKLKEALFEKLNPKPQIIMDEAVGHPVIAIVHFATLYEFVHWYENNKIYFNEKQQSPLNSLIEARNITVGGCNCDLEKRKMIASDYFKKFWQENRHTDLLPTLLNALKTKKIIFSDFLAYPE